MTEDARFEDGGEKPLNLGALDTDDLDVLSALVQDAVLTGADVSWDRKRGRLSLLVNRLRREDAGQHRGDRPVERVRSLLVVDTVMGVSSQGVQRGDADTVLSVLALEFAETEAPSGHIVVTLAGDGAIRATVEAIEVTLRDVTRPYAAPSGKLPDHTI